MYTYEYKIEDENIALINELSMIFHKMDIDTKSVLKAHSFRWEAK